MTTFASLFNDKVNAVVYGTALDVKAGNASDFAATLTRGSAGPVQLVRTSAISVAGVCLPIKETLLVVGAGAASDGKCGANGPQEEMWVVPLSAPLGIVHTEVTTLSDLLSRSTDDYEPQGLQIYFKDVKESGSIVSGTVVINWEEKIAGKRVVIIRQSIPFQISGRTRVYEKTIDVIFGIKVKVYVDIYFELNPNRICVEARAKWPGGNAGDVHCEPF